MIFQLCDRQEMWAQVSALIKRPCSALLRVKNLYGSRKGASLQRDLEDTVRMGTALVSMLYVITGCLVSLPILPNKELIC